MKKLGFLGVIALAGVVLASCGKDKEAKLVDTFYQTANVRIACTDEPANKNHNTISYVLQVFDDKSYVMTYSQTNAVTMLDMTYGRIITSEGKYTVETTDTGSTYTLALPTHITMAAHSRNNVHTYVDTDNWNQGTEETDPGVSYKLYDYGTLETYETVADFNAVYAKTYTATVATGSKQMAVTVTNGSQVALPLIGVTA